MEKKLLEPAQLGNLKLKNRLIRSATSQAMSPTMEYDPARLLKVYGDIVKGGVGAIVTSFPLVDQGYHRNPATQENRERVYERIVELCHAEGCPAIAQLVLVNYGGNGSVDELTREDFAVVEDLFAAAARRAAQAGYDGVQLHVAHGLFLSRFVSPAHNHRTDEYGGDQRRRTKLVLDIVRRIRSESPDLHLSMKINHSDDTPGGLTEDQSLETCLLCASAEMDSIEVSGNGSSVSGIRAGVDESYYKGFALRLSASVSVPVILVGGNRSIENMERVLNEGSIEFMSLSRPLIREPDLPRRWLDGDTRPATCVSCNMCYRTPWQECTHSFTASEI